MTETREECISRLKAAAKKKGKATGSWEDPVTGLIETFTYEKDNGEVRLMFLDTNIYDVCPPFMEERPLPKRDRMK